MQLKPERLRAAVDKIIPISHLALDMNVKNVYIMTGTCIEGIVSRLHGIKKKKNHHDGV